jgi:hypothetical protein
MPELARGCDRGSRPHRGSSTKATSSGPFQAPRSLLHWERDRWKAAAFWWAQGDHPTHAGHSVPSARDYSNNEGENRNVVPQNSFNWRRTGSHAGTPVFTTIASAPKARVREIVRCGPAPSPSALRATRSTLSQRERAHKSLTEISFRRTGSTDRGWGSTQ